MKLKNKQINLLYIVDDFPSISTPFILNQITGMIDRGVNVRILTRRKQTVKIIHEDIKKYKLLDNLYYFDQIDLSIKGRLKYFAFNFFQALFYSPKKVIKSVNVIKYKKHAFSLRLFHEVNSLLKYNFEDIDIIHAQFGTLGVMTLRLKEIGVLKGKLITHFRGYDLENTLRFEGYKFYDRLFKKGDFFLSNCNYFKDYIIKKGAPANKTEVQYSGIKTSFFNTLKKDYILSDIIKLGSVGSLRKKKGYQYIIDALKILDNNNFRYTYEVVGDGILRKELEQKVKQLKLKGKVIFHGSQNHTYIKSFLSNLDVFLSHNIETDSGDMDAPVNTIKEAMLIGVPVISTFHGGIPEIIENNKTGFMTKEKASDKIAEKIIDVCKLYKEKKIEFITILARKYVKKTFDNDLLNNHLLNLYKTYIK